jgi:hypothetical protein
VSSNSRPLIVACGALVSELRAVLERNGLTEAIEVKYLPANLHNRPEGIVPALAEVVGAAAGRPVFVGYADCGTGGALDRYLEAHPGISRIPGAHCYEFFAGSERFADDHAAEPGTFYLTDFLAKHFDALVWSGLGLDRHPELRDTYFSNYTTVVLYTQTTDPGVIEAGQRAAEKLGLDFRHEHVGIDGLEAAIPVSFRSHSTTKREEN